MWRELCYYVAQNPKQARLRMLEQELHNTPQKLGAEIQKNIDQMDGRSDYILIGYGLCSNVIVGLSAHKSILVVPRAHDCITFFLGSKTRYANYFDSRPGTFWYNSGWIECSFQPGPEQMRELRAAYIEKYGEENADYLMEMERDWHQNYKHATYITSPLVDNEPLRAYTKECAAYLGWEYDEVDGDFSLFTEFLAGLENGVWDENKFLVVPPGHQVEASFDSRIIKSAATGSA